jgi:hypothetical protein
MPLPTPTTTSVPAGLNARSTSRRSRGCASMIPTRARPAGGTGLSPVRLPAAAAPVGDEGHASAGQYGRYGGVWWRGAGPADVRGAVRLFDVGHQLHQVTAAMALGSRGKRATRPATATGTLTTSVAAAPARPATNRPSPGRLGPRMRIRTHQHGLSRSHDFARRLLARIPDHRSQHGHVGAVAGHRYDRARVSG